MVGWKALGRKPLYEGLKFPPIDASLSRPGPAGPGRARSRRTLRLVAWPRRCHVNRTPSRAQVMANWRRANWRRVMHGRPALVMVKKNVCRKLKQTFVLYNDDMKQIRSNMRTNHVTGYPLMKFTDDKWTNNSNRKTFKKIIQSEEKATVSVASMRPSQTTTTENREIGYASQNHNFLQKSQCSSSARWISLASYWSKHRKSE